GSNYYYYNLVNFNDGTGSTSVVSSKSSPKGTWNFTYTPGTSGNPDVTSVSTPLGSNITYRHFGYGSVAPGTTWKIGLLQQRVVGAVQTESYTWSSQQISQFPTDRGYANFNDFATYAPVLTQRAIIRDGATYTTNYSNFDQYGNPQAIDESG